jgi:hypothetical protein
LVDFWWNRGRISGGVYTISVNHHKEYNKD